MQARGVTCWLTNGLTSLQWLCSGRLTAHREKALSVHAILPGYSLQLDVIRFNGFCSARHFGPVWVYIFRCAFFWHLTCTLQQLYWLTKSVYRRSSANTQQCGQCLGLPQAIHLRCLTPRFCAYHNPKRPSVRFDTNNSWRTSASSRFSGASETGYTHSALTGVVTRHSGNYCSCARLLWPACGMQDHSRPGCAVFLLCKVSKP